MKKSRNVADYGDDQFCCYKSVRCTPELLIADGLQFYLASHDGDSPGLFWFCCEWYCNISFFGQFVVYQEKKCRKKEKERKEGGLPGVGILR